MDGLPDGLVLSVHTPDPSWRRVGVPSLRGDQKSPPASHGISSWEVLISNRALDTSYLAGSLTSEGIFCPDSSNKCRTQAITRPRAAHTEITPLPL